MYPQRIISVLLLALLLVGCGQQQSKQNFADSDPMADPAHRERLRNILRENQRVLGAMPVAAPDSEWEVIVRIQCEAAPQTASTPTEHYVTFDADSTWRIRVEKGQGSVETEPIDAYNDWFSHGTLIAGNEKLTSCLLYTSPSPRDATLSRMPSSA